MEARLVRGQRKGIAGFRARARADTCGYNLRKWIPTQVVIGAGDVRSSILYAA